MHLSPKEIDKLMLHNAGFLAQKRYARGLKLNYVETMALISAQVLEFIRDGNTVAQLMEKGKHILGFADVLPGVERMIPEVQVEGTFPDGTKLVTIHQPICRENGDEKLALYASGLTRSDEQPPVPNSLASFTYEGMIRDPGATVTVVGDIELNGGRTVTKLNVTNHGDRPVQVGSHYPFFETNPALEFDRALAYGKRLDIPAGTAVRFEPGETKEVQLVKIGGSKTVYGGNALISGQLGEAAQNVAQAVQKAVSQGFSHREAQSEEK